MKIEEGYPKVTRRNLNVLQPKFGNRSRIWSFRTGSKSLPDNLKQKKLARALERLGFEIDTKGGSGSHIKATYRANQKSVTIPHMVRRDVLYYLLKEIESQTGISWEDIRRFL